MQFNGYKIIEKIVRVAVLDGMKQAAENDNKLTAPESIEFIIDTISTSLSEILLESEEDETVAELYEAQNGTYNLQEEEEEKDDFENN